jgi:hypothetical protein
MLYMMVRFNCNLATCDSFAQVIRIDAHESVSSQDDCPVHVAISPQDW